jgi:hypothetical protein
MLIWNMQSPRFFQRKPEVADPRLLTGEIRGQAVTPDV